MVHIKDAYYFSHDSNARSDPKIMALLNSYGMEGYGRWWVIVEMLREQCNYKLPNEEWVFDALAMAMLCDANSTKKLIDDCVNRFKLLQKDDNYLWSNSLLRRMEKREEEREKKVEAGRKGAEKRWKDGNAKATPKQRHSGGIAKDSKESKVKESKEEIYSDFVSKIIKIYPGKKTKAERDKKLPKILKEHGEEKILKCVERYAAETKGKPTKFILLESTFWNGRYIDYLDENYIKSFTSQETRIGVPPSESDLGPKEDKEVWM